MEKKTPPPKVGEHDLTIGAFRQRKRLGMDITRMAIKLLFGHGSEDGLDDCRIDVIHDLLEKRGNVFTEMADQGRPILVLYYEVFRGFFIDCISFFTIDYKIIM